MMFMRSVFCSIQRGSVGARASHTWVGGVGLSMSGAALTRQYAVTPGRQALPDFVDACPFEIAGHHAGTFLAYRDDLAPRVDQHAVSPCAAAILVLAALRRGEHVTLVLDGAGAQQHFPVRAAGRVGESGRHHDQRAIAQPAVQLRETQIVADRQADSSERRLEGADLGARADGARFVERFFTFFEVEQVNLVVAGDFLALRVEDQRGVQDAVRFGRRDRQCAAYYPYAVAARRVGKKALDRAVAVGFAYAELIGVLKNNETEGF